MLKSMVSALLQSLTMIIFLLSAIPLIVHFRLRNWPAFYISLWLTVYNLIQFANITLSQHIFDDSKQDNIYQFCTIYAGTTTALQLAISFGSFRLLQQLCSLVTPAERWTLRKRLLGVLSSSRKASDSDADHTTHRSVSSTIIYSASHTSSHSSFGSWYRSRIAVYHSRITDFFWGIALPIALIVIWKTSSATLPKNQDAFQYVYLSGVGCAMVMVDSLLSVLILCITPAVMSACSLYYTVYIIVRLASSRRALNALLAERTSISQSTFQRLVGFCAFYDIIAMVYTIYSMVYFFTNTAPTIPMPEDELIMLNKLALWSKPLISPTILLLAVLSLAWILFFGTNTEAINMYRQIYGSTKRVFLRFSTQSTPPRSVLLKGQICESLSSCNLRQPCSTSVDSVSQITLVYANAPPAASHEFINMRNIPHSIHAYDILFPPSAHLQRRNTYL